MTAESGLWIDRAMAEAIVREGPCGAAARGEPAYNRGVCRFCDLASMLAELPPEPRCSAAHGETLCADRHCLRHGSESRP